MNPAERSTGSVMRKYYLLPLAVLALALIGFGLFMIWPTGSTSASIVQNSFQTITGSQPSSPGAAYATQNDEGGTEIYLPIQVGAEHRAQQNQQNSVPSELLDEVQQVVRAANVDCTPAGDVPCEDGMPFTVVAPNNPPVVTISAPTDGATFTEGDSVTFTGTANDTEDGDLTASIDWVSDIDGDLGTDGGSFSTTSLSVGTHLITAGVLDSNGASSSETLSVVINGTADTTDPDTTLTSPTNDTSVTLPLNITGSAMDDVGVSSVQLVIKNKTTGEYWNGTAFQSAYIRVNATLGSPDAISTTYTYAVPSLPDGNFYISARAFDAAYNYDTSIPFANVSYSSGDAINPDTQITAPTNGANISLPLDIVGTATDNVGVASVKLVVRNIGTGEYWNGTAFQAAYARVDAILASPGAASTTFSYTIATLPESSFYISTRSIDTTGNFDTTPDSASVSYVETDMTPPSATLTNPTAGENVSVPLTISGNATDDTSVSSVKIVLRDLNTGEYWNGTAFQSAYTRVDANLTSQGAMATDYDYTVNSLPENDFYVSVRPIDADGNFMQPPVGVTFTHSSVSAASLLSKWLDMGDDLEWMEITPDTKDVEDSSKLFIPLIAK